MKLGGYPWWKPVLWGLEILLILSLMGSIIHVWNKKDVVSDRKQVLSRVEAEHERLKQKLSEAQSQPFIEREAREKLGLVKPGEVIVLVGQSSSSASRGIQTGAALSHWRQWWKLFF